MTAGEEARRFTPAGVLYKVKWTKSIWSLSLSERRAYAAL
jgi:hypothetical protein